jgi:hypothetical protein
MATVTAIKDEEVQLQFAVLDVDGITPLSGLIDSDFTKTILRDDVDETGSVAVTISEVGSTARYIAAFTPNANGLWYVDALVIPTDDLLACYVEVGVGSALQIQEVWQRLGLDPDNPLCVSKTQQVTGTIVLKQTEVGDTLVITREP